MKSLNIIQKLFKIGKILSRIAFILSVVGFCGCIAGLFSLRFGGNIIKIKGITLHRFISWDLGCDIKSVFAALCGFVIVCAGEAVLAKFAEIYFKNELKAETPFTVSGAKEMLRLGILTIVVPTVCAMARSIFEEIAVGFTGVEKASFMDIYFNNAASIVLGVMFILISLLCQYGAELRQNEKA